MRRQAQRSSQLNGTSVVTEMKSRQAAKIRELGQSLIDAGFVALDQQCEALGLARSTTWTILRANHKGSGLSAAIIKRMLLWPQLPPLARSIIVEYTRDKLAGAYGGSRAQRHRFFARLSGSMTAISLGHAARRSRLNRTATTAAINVSRFSRGLISPTQLRGQFEVAKITSRPQEFASGCVDFLLGRGARYPR